MTRPGPHDEAFRARQRRRRLAAALAGLVMVLAAIGSQSVFTVDAAQAAAVRGFGGQCTPARPAAGLHLKWPWQRVSRVDRRVRLLVLDPQEKRTLDGEPVVVQPCAFWRLSEDGLDPFLRGGGDEAAAEQLLSDLIRSALDRELARRPLTDWLNPGGDAEPASRPPLLTLPASVTRVCRPVAFARLGIDLIEVQMRRFDRPGRLKPALVRFTSAHRLAEVARQNETLRLRQAERDVEARCQADRILAEAAQQAQAIRAAARREAGRIEAEARRINPELIEELLSWEDGPGCRRGGLPSQPVGPAEVAGVTPGEKPVRIETAPARAACSTATAPG